MEPHLVLQIVCNDCGHKDLLSYTAINAHQQHTCAQCGEPIDLAQYQKMALEFARVSAHCASPEQHPKNKR